MKAATEFEGLWAEFHRSPTLAERSRINQAIAAIASAPADEIDDIISKVVVFCAISDVDLNVDADPGLGANRIASDRLMRSIYQNLIQIRERNQQAA